MVKCYELYGIEGYQDVVEEIINCFNISHIQLDVQMILTEAMNNAYQHGNMYDSSKLIKVKVSSDVLDDKEAVKFEISDQGMGFEFTERDAKFHQEDLLEEDGRGMLLITYYSDKIVIDKNVVTIYKTL